MWLPAPPYSPEAGVARRALIVDDDRSVRFVLREALLGHGWEVEEADDGSQVEERLESTRYDLLMLDLYMPGMNGYEVLRRIRQPHSGVHAVWKTLPTVRIVVLSGAAGQGGLDFAERLGADSCLAKPFEVADIVAAAGGRSGR